VILEFFFGFWFPHATVAFWDPPAAAWMVKKPRRAKRETKNVNIFAVLGFRMLRWPFEARQRPPGGSRKPTVPCGELKLSTFIGFLVSACYGGLWRPAKGRLEAPENSPYHAEN
jgi:hypothetical protein